MNVLHRRLAPLWVMLVVAATVVGGGVNLHLPVAAQDGELPDEIVYELPGHFPEGIEWDAERERFLLGSLTQGTIVAVTDDAAVAPLVTYDPPVSTVGLEIDEERDRLLAVIADSSVFFDQTALGMAQLGAYDLETGEATWVADLGALLPEARHFANDVAVDPATGAAYVTDSFAGVVYQVTAEGKASVLLQDDQLLGAPGANGIEFHPDGYLIVAVTTRLTLYKLDLADATLTPIEIDVPVIGDGLVLDAEGNLIVVGATLTGGSQALATLRLTSDDDWASASLTGIFVTEKQASTAAIREGEVYIIYPDFEALNSGADAETFTIQRATFSEPEPAAEPTLPPTPRPTPEPEGTAEPSS